MPGRKALSDPELAAVLDAARLFPRRAQALLILGVNTGYRIHELLSLTVGQVWDGTTVRPCVCVARARLKGGRGSRRRAVTSRVIPLNARCAAALTPYLQTRAAGGTGHPAAWLFPSRQGQGPLSADQANRIVKRIIEAAGLEAGGPWGTHTLRKTYCRRIFQLSKFNLVLTKAAMGHAHLSTTERYLTATEDAAAAVIKALGEERPANFAVNQQIA